MPTMHRAQPPRSNAPLTKDGGKSAPLENPLLSNATLQQMYLAMLKLRVLSESLISSQLLKPKVQGMEAALAGLAAGLLPKDLICPSQFEAHVRFAGSVEQNPPLARLLAAMRMTNPPGASKRRTDSRRTEADLSLAAEWNVANGIALAQTIVGNCGIAMVFSRSDPADQDGLKEAVAFAAFRKLPIVYSLWDSGGDGGSKVRASLRHEMIRSTAGACGVPVITVDGTDAIAVYRVAHECIQRARNGDGPALIECRGGKPGSGSTSRPISGSRSQRGSKSASAKQVSASAAPLDQMERYLARKGLFTPAWRREHLTEFTRHVKAAARGLGDGGAR